MSFLVGNSEAITVGSGAVGRCGPGVQIVPDPDPPGPPPTCGITDDFNRVVGGTTGGPPGVPADTFDSDISGWTAESWAGFSAVAAIAYQGADGSPSSGCLEATFSSGGDQQFLWRLTGLTLYAGVTYTLTFNIKQFSGSGNYQWGIGSISNTGLRGVAFNQSISGSWVGKTASYTPPSNITDPAVWFSSWGSNTSVIRVDTVAVAVTSGTFPAGSYLGRATCGRNWLVGLTGSATASVDGSAGVLAVPARTTASAAMMVPETLAFDSTTVHSMQFSLNNFGDPALSTAEKITVSFRPFGGSLVVSPHIVIIPSNSSLWLQGIGPTPGASAYSQITWTSDVISGTAIPLAFWQAGRVYTFSVYASGGNMVASVTDGVSTYSVLGPPPIYAVDSLSFSVDRDLVAPFTTTVVTTAHVDNLTVPEVTLCTLGVTFDDFDRSIASGGWGTASPDPAAHVYSVSGSGAATPTIGVHAATSNFLGYGFIQYVTANTQRSLVLPAPGPWTSATGFTMSFWFWGNHTGSFFDISQLGGLLELEIGIGPSGFVDLGTFNFDNEDFVSAALSLNTWYVCKLDYQPNVLARAKVWELGTTEPTSWTVTVNVAGAALSLDLFLGLYAPSTQPSEQRIANLDFTDA